MLHRTFAAKKFFLIFLPALLSMSIEYMLIVSDHIIAGYLIGTEGLTAITLVQPLFSVLVFLSLLISIGSAIMSSFETGRQNREQANRYFSQGLILTFALGGVVTAICVCLKPWLFMALAGEEAALGYAYEYFSWLLFLPIPLGLHAFLFTFSMNEGRENLCTVSAIVQFISNLGVSFFLCLQIGIAGLAIGTVFSNVVAIALLSFQFFSPRNMLRFVWHFRIDESLRIFKFGICDSLPYLLLSVSEAGINFYLLYRFGAEAIVVFTVLMSVFLLCLTALDGVSQAIQPLVCMYRGEGNSLGIRKVMKLAVGIVFAKSLLFMAIVILGDVWIIRLFYHEEAKLLGEIQTALHLYALSFPFLAMVMLFATYLLNMERVKISVFFTVLLLLVYLLPCVVLFGECFGMNGVWMGMTISALLSFVSMALVLWYLSKKEASAFPLLLDYAHFQRQLSFDINMGKQDFQEFLAKVKNKLQYRGVEEQKSHKIVWLIESIGKLLWEKNHKKFFLLECTLMETPQGMQLILRYDGCYCNPVDGTISDASKPLQEECEYLWKSGIFSPAGGDNRVVYRIE